MNKLKGPNFDVSTDDAALIAKIVVRACSMLNLEEQLGSSRLELAMDLTACHANGTTLKLKELLEAPKFDFVHDIAGISNHIDRATGQLRDCFLPRCARLDEESEEDCACGGTGVAPGITGDYEPCPECLKRFPHSVSPGSDHCVYCGMVCPEGVCPALCHPNRARKEMKS